MLVMASFVLMLSLEGVLEGRRRGDWAECSAACVGVLAGLWGLWWTWS